MPAIRHRVLELALENLTAEKNRIDAEIAELQAQLRDGRTPNQRTSRGIATRPRATGKRKQAQRNPGRRVQTTHALSMKKLWAKARRAGFSNLKDYKASLSKR